MNKMTHFVSLNELNISDFRVLVPDVVVKNFFFYVLESNSVKSLFPTASGVLFQQL
jgi:hypothetical protein